MIFSIQEKCPLGMNVARTQRLIKKRLGLVARPFIAVVGIFDFHANVYRTGEGRLLQRAPTDEDPDPPELALDDAQLAIVHQALLESAPANGAGRIRIDDLEDLGENTEKGQVVYVADLPRLTTGAGTLAYWTGNKWRRVSDDTEISL